MTDISELNALRARIDELEAQAARDNQERVEQRTSRRGMLRLAGAAAIGGLAATVAADPAAADAGHVHMDVFNNAATLPTGIAVTAPGGAAYGLAAYEAGLGALPSQVGRPAVFGHATGTAFTKGVAGHNTLAGGTGVHGFDSGTGDTGVGVHGQSFGGFGVFGSSGNIGVRGATATGTGVQGITNTAIGEVAVDGNGLRGFGAKGALRLVPNVINAPPSRATEFVVNTLETDGAGNVWFCYESGMPGKWRKIAGPATAGAFHAITPTRVYDSRAAAPTPGLLASGSNRLVSVADGRDNGGAVTAVDLVPAGATAVAANVTITGTTGGFGYLAINPGGNTNEGASTINWSAEGQSLANGVTLTLNASRQLTVICNGGGSTHFIIDISGYYL